MLLMEEAERIAREEHGSHKISVISGKQYVSLSSLNSPAAVLDLQPQPFPIQVLSNRRNTVHGGLGMGTKSME